MNAELLKILPQFDVISFDIFDTLLLRSVLNPQDVWRMVEEREGAKGFFKARQQADRATYRAATKRGGEHTIDEAYALMGSRWSTFNQKEFECEARVLVGNPEMREIWQRAGALGKRRVIVSDMYLPGEFIKERLLSCGISGWDGFYLSCERQKRKATGELFKVMMEEQNVSPSLILHIGDNAYSDQQVPERFGISSICYPKVTDRFREENPFVNGFLDEQLSVSKSRLVGALSVAWHSFVVEHRQWNYWHRFGFLMGGVLGYMYVRWIGENAHRRGIKHLMFVGRDGYIWQKMIKAMFSDIKTDYFYAPRLTNVFVTGYRGRKRGVVADRCQAALDYLRCHAGIELSDEESNRYIETGEFPSRFECKTTALVQDIRENYKLYLHQFDIESETTALVDGCSSEFSAQRLVENVLGKEIFTFYLNAMSPLAKGAALYATRDDGVPFQGLSEFVFGAPNAPVREIGVNGPCFGDAGNAWEKLKISVSDDIAAGAVACARFLFQNDVPVDKTLWMQFYVAFMSSQAVLDKEYFSFARNATDVRQSKSIMVACTRGHHQRILLSLWGHVWCSPSGPRPRPLWRQS